MGWWIICGRGKFFFFLVAAAAAARWSDGVDFFDTRTSMECGRIDLEGTKRKLSVCKEDISDDYPEEEEIHRQGVPSS